MIFKHIKDVIQRKAPLKSLRSPYWKHTRKEHLRLHPTCAACGGKFMIEAHHIVPFHVRPDLELQPDNLITLCRKHHLVFGHLGNFKWWNDYVAIDTRRWADKRFAFQHKGDLDGSEDGLRGDNGEKGEHGAEVTAQEEP